LSRLVTQGLTLLPPVLVLLLTLLEFQTALLAQGNPGLIFGFATAPSSPLTHLTEGVLLPNRFQLLPGLILLATLFPQLTTLGRERSLGLTQHLLLGFEVHYFGFNLISLITGSGRFSLTARHKFGHGRHIIQTRLSKNQSRMIWLTHLGSIRRNDQATRGTTDGW
jgi:hypothetical protein